MNLKPYDSPKILSVKNLAPWKKPFGELYTRLREQEREARLARIERRNERQNKRAGR